MKKISFSSFLGVILSILSLDISSEEAPSKINMAQGVTPVSQNIYDLHMVVFIICVIVFIGVLGFMMYSVVYHRKSKRSKPANFSENILVEIVWTAIPLVILVIIAIPATSVLIDLEADKKADLTIKITGYQWKWQYEYLDENINFFSNLAETSRKTLTSAKKPDNYLLEVDNPLVIPVNKRIRFLLTSNDVIHSWWVPAFGLKQDTIPGFINDSWAKVQKLGTYRGQCAELCGKDHGFMPIVVKVKTEKDYKTWVEKQKTLAQKILAQSDKKFTIKELMSEGEKVYQKSCAACHGVTGDGIPGIFPGLKNNKITTQKDQIDNHIDIVLNGKAGTSMQAFKDQLTDKELAAIITYERNAWGNDTKDIIQPSDIKNKR